MTIEQNSCCDSTSIGFDQSQPQQYTVNHPIFNAHNEYLDSLKKLTITQTMIAKQMTSLTSMCEVACQIVQKKLEEKQLEEEQTAKAQNWKLPVCYDDDDDGESSNSLADNIISELPSENLFEPFFDEEINPMKIDQHPFNSESDLIGSMPNHDSSITISSKIDSLFDEFAGELTLLKSISPGIDKTDCHPEKETRLTKRLLYDNSSPRPTEEIVSDNSNADIESFSPSPIPNEDSDSHMEEIDLPFTPDDPMPLGIEDDDYDSGRDILILEELLDNYSLSLSANDSYHFDIPSPYRPPAKPPDGNTGTLNIKMMGDVSDQKVHIPGLTITQLLDNYSLSLPANDSYHFDIPSPYRPPAKPPDGNTGTLNIKMMGDVSDQKVPIPGLTITRILNQEKLPDLLSHQGLEAFQPSDECPMIINGKNIPLLDVLLFHFYPP
nr:hypothetical protein [Tanacetum cinerariifolium]